MGEEWCLLLVGGVVTLAAALLLVRRADLQELEVVAVWTEQREAAPDLPRPAHPQLLQESGLVVPDGLQLRHQSEGEPLA